MKKAVSLILTAVLLMCCFAAAGVSVNAASKPVPGYYVVGTMNNWALDKDYLMEPSCFDNHYQLLQIPLKAGDELKVVYSDDGLWKSKWYPQGTENNFIVHESCEYYNIELAPDYDGVGEGWYEGCIKAQPCPPPIDTPDPTVPEPVNRTKQLWQSGAALTAADIEEAVNERYNSQQWIFADKIKLWNSYRFCCTPAYAVDYDAEGYGYYAEVITEEYFGDYLLWSPCAYEPSIFVDNKLYPFTKAYQSGLLTQEMLAELVEADYQGGAFGLGGCRILTRNIKGDADGDGEVTVIDATYIQRYDVGIYGAGDFFKPLGDVDGDNEATIIDAALIQRHLVGICEI